MSSLLHTWREAAFGRRSLIFVGKRVWIHFNKLRVVAFGRRPPAVFAKASVDRIYYVANGGFLPPLKAPLNQISKTHGRGFQ